MTSFFMIGVFWMLSISLVSFCLVRKHILLSLLSLEMLVLTLMLMMLIYFSFCLMESYFYLLFLIFVVCEGVSGLCIIVSLMRSYGNDYVFGLFLLC
nr:NADH dehydrogenase subunit 4L [Peloridium hammoniorum]